MIRTNQNNRRVSTNFLDNDHCMHVHIYIDNGWCKCSRNVIKKLRIYKIGKWVSKFVMEIRVKLMTVNKKICSNMFV